MDEPAIALCTCAHPMGKHVEGFDFCSVDECECEQFQQVEIAGLVERLERMAVKYETAGPPRMRALLKEASAAIEALASAVDDLSEIIEAASSGG